MPHTFLGRKYQLSKVVICIAWVLLSTNYTNNKV